MKKEIIFQYQSAKGENLC